jgi:hypothetical protein
VRGPQLRKASQDVELILYPQGFRSGLGHHITRQEAIVHRIVGRAADNARKQQVRLYALRLVRVGIEVFKIFIIAGTDAEHQGHEGYGD